MPLNNNGEFEGRRPSVPPHIRRQSTGWELNHIIPWESLRCFWDELARRGNGQHILQYLRIVGAGAEVDGFDDAIRTRVARWIEGRNMPRSTALPPGDFKNQLDILDQVICWQPYNLFEGPNEGNRPGHAPPPANMAGQLARRGTYDFPPSAQEHVDRGDRLEELFDHMTRYIHHGSGFNRCLAALESVPECESQVIPRRDFNWFGLPMRDFEAMVDPNQRQRFFDACWNEGRWAANGCRVYTRLFRQYANRR